MAPGELPARVGGVDVGFGNRPDRRRPRALPPDRHRAGRRGVPDRVSDAEGPCGLAVGHARAAEDEAQPLGRVLGARAALCVLGQPPEREQREVAFRDDVCAVAGAPELREGGVLPGRRPHSLDPRVEREQRGPRHAVLQPGPRRPPQRRGALGHPLVEAADRAPVGQDLPSVEPESRVHRAFEEPSGAVPAVRRSALAHGRAVWCVGRGRAQGGGC